MAVYKWSPDFFHCYILGRTYTPISRLNYEHYLWRETLHFNLHPSISVPEDARIADVATGITIWLMQVSREYPTAQLYGFDINDYHAPPIQWRSPNIMFRNWDISDNLPQVMVGVYDVVHARLPPLVMQKIKPGEFLFNLIRMLKPGGYIQWDVFDYPGTHVKKSSNGSDTPALNELREIVYSRGKNNWTLQLPEMFVNQGLIDTEMYQFQDLPEFERANSEQHLSTMEGIALSLMEDDRPKEAASIVQLIREGGAEVAVGSVLSMPRLVCVGRKASEWEDQA